MHIANWIDITKAPYFGFDPDLHTLFIKCVPRTVSRADIFETVSLLEGYLGITISDPVKKFNLMRYCWIEFASEETCAKAELALNGVIIKNETLVVNKSTSKAKRVKVLKNYPRSRLETDLQTVLNLAKTLDHECEINDNPLFTKGFPSLQVGFDTLLLYLRRVHAYDYFSSAQFEN